MGEKTLRSVPPHTGHSVSDASLMDCWMSKALPHAVQR